MAHSFTDNFNYDIFLSFRGEDTRRNFTGNLYSAFDRRGIITFLDDQNLRSGNEISPSLFKAIEESRMFVIVFSENYASSTWCLDELVKILQCAEKNQEQNKQCVWPIFYKVDPSDIRHQRNSYGNAMIQHEERFGKDSEKVRSWRSALTRVANLKGDHFKTTGYDYECDFIDKIVKKISIRLHPKLPVGDPIVGLEHRIEEVISLLDISSQSTICMLGIYGIGGIGKTTLAKAFYNLIAHQFDHACFLFDVRERSNESKGILSLQKTLLSKMFEADGIRLDSVDEGASLIKNRLHNKRVLLVLDDVDCEEQLEKLAGECNWFGLGSRIILTTRNKHLLHAPRVEKTYQMRGLNANEALEVFCWKAFNSSQPEERFVGFSNRVVNYADGLPLALKVIGSHLYGKDLDECVCALDQYKRIPNKSIQDILRISYDGLEENQKEIFLDIACFFKGYYLKVVTNAWEACDFGPKYNIKVLVEKSLISISENGYIGMHDLIQDMGKEVVRKVAPKDLGKRRRLWLVDDVVKVLEGNLGTKNIEGIMLSSPRQEIKWKGTALKNMINLRILIIKDACFSVGPKYLPNSLHLLEWNQYPLTSLPSNFNPKKLAVLQLPDSSLKLIKPLENFKYLSVMNFSFCQFITEVPDMSGALALKTLRFYGCENLVKVDDSIGFLPKVTFLDFRCCGKLTSLVSAMQMKSLEGLYIQGCTSLEHISDIWGNMDNLVYIYASDTAIKKLPNSIGNLTSLISLTVSGSNLVSIPGSIRKLSNLMVLDIEGCENLEEIYEIPSNLSDIRAANTLLTSHSCSVLWSQAIKETLHLDIDFPGAHIPNWFDHCCKGHVLSFWARRKLPNAAFAFIHKSENGWLDGCLSLFINSIEVKNVSCDLKSECGVLKGCHARLKNLNELWGGCMTECVERYLLLEWNYVEIEVTPFCKRDDLIVDECGIYVFKQGTNMEDVRFENPYLIQPAELVLRNALKRAATFRPKNEPPKKFRRKHERRDCRGKFQNPRAKKRKTCSVQIGNQNLPQNQHNDIDFPWERLWNLHLSPKVIIFLWELVNCVLPAFDVQVPQTCSLCGVENETSQHIFMQCTFARALWFGSQLSLWPDRLKPSDVVNLIELCLQMGNLKAEIHKEFTCPMAIILYTIWYFRNKAIFKGETPPSSEAALKVWLRFCQKYIVACPAIKQTNYYSATNRAHEPLWLYRGTYRVYISVHRVKKFTTKITYCQAFILDDSMYRDLVGNFLMSGATTKFQVLFQGLKSLLTKKSIVKEDSALNIYMPSTSCIAMLNDPSMAPPRLQTIIKDVNCLLMSFPERIPSIRGPFSRSSARVEFSCGSFPYSSSVGVKLRSLGSMGKWRFYEF